MLGPLHAPTVVLLYPFRFRDPVTHKWVKARDVAVPVVVLSSPVVILSSPVAVLASPVVFVKSGHSAVPFLFMTLRQCGQRRQ